jgi:hypothetical protein
MSLCLKLSTIILCWLLGAWKFHLLRLDLLLAWFVSSFFGDYFGLLLELLLLLKHHSRLILLLLLLHSHHLCLHNLLLLWSHLRHHLLILNKLLLLLLFKLHLLLLEVQLLLLGDIASCRNVSVGSLSSELALLRRIISLGSCVKGHAEDA